MDSEIQAPGPELTPAPHNTVHDIFIGPNGLRAGWSIAIFFALFAGFQFAFYAAGSFFARTVLHRSLDSKGGLVPFTAIFSEGLGVLALLSAVSIVAVIERRRLLDYNLTGPGRVTRFLSGLVIGFAALSALVGALHLGGWLQFGTPALTGIQIARWALIWSFGFLLVGLFEEGIARCYLQFTLTRGVNFWWMLGLVLLMCAILAPHFKSQAAWGVWAFAAVGLAHCLWLHLRKSGSGAFWYAAWITSTFFGFIHTSNNGETWIGIFAAAAIGFVFCVSVYVTGSAWWAIGCHAAWDWAETFFYGTADSGFTAKGHLLTTAPAGNALWSGGTDGPEGSLLVLPTIALILVIVLVQYGRTKKAAPAAV
jgi:hypothetical protein